MSIKTDINSIDPKWGQPQPTHDPLLLANFQPESTDVLITTAPKAGTTWMQQILYQMKTGGDPDFENINDVVPWLELPQHDKTWQQTLEDYQNLSRPRLFKTHCTAEQTPGIGIASIVLSFRDPRDCFVSFYHHVMNMTDSAREITGIPKPESISSFLDDWLEHAVWYRNVKSWWPYHEHDKVLILRFQDMKQDLSKCIDQLSTFLGWKLTSNQKEKVLDYSSFNWMKSHDDKFSNQIQAQAPSFKPGKFIRRGNTGDFQATLTTEMEQRIIDQACRDLEPDCLRFLEL